MKIVTFEGSDYSGKSTTVLEMAKRFRKNKDFAFNEGAIYPTSLMARLFAIASQCNEAEREFIYTTLFEMDKLEQAKHPEDKRLVFQDRYWPSTIAYGRFLNKDKSIHNVQDFRGTFIQPSAVIYLSCTIEEKRKRSTVRGRKSILDGFLLDNPQELSRLEFEIERSLEGLPNIIRIDTTGISVNDVIDKVMDSLPKSELDNGY